MWWGGHCLFAKQLVAVSEPTPSCQAVNEECAEPVKLSERLNKEMCWQSSRLELGVIEGMKLRRYDRNFECERECTSD